MVELSFIIKCLNRVLINNTLSSTANDSELFMDERKITKQIDFISEVFIVLNSLNN
jgi:hypothetical protein